MSMIKTLEKMFAAEIEGRYFQSKAKIMKKLEADGYVEYRSRDERTSLGMMHAEWWELTHLGRLTYCSTCDDSIDDIQEKP